MAPGGGTLVDPAGIPLSTTAATGSAVVSLGSSYLVAWDDLFVAGTVSIRGDEVSDSGNAELATFGELAGGEGFRMSPRLATNGTHQLLVYSHYNQVYARLLAFTATPGVCGDGVVDPNEECDDGDVATAACDIDCTYSFCGDGVVNPAAGEECDGPEVGGVSCGLDCVLANPADTIPPDPQGCGCEMSSPSQSLGLGVGLFLVWVMCLRRRKAAPKQALSH